jgi:hypothetical protein
VYGEEELDATPKLEDPSEKLDGLEDAVEDPQRRIAPLRPPVSFGARLPCAIRR